MPRKSPFGKFEIKSPKIPSITVVKPGDRTLTPADKKRVKIERDFKCEKCHKKFAPNHLEVHHINEISKVIKKAGLMGQFGSLIIGKRKKAYHDRDVNLMVLCLFCHKDLHGQGKKKKPKRKSTNLFGIRRTKRWQKHT